MKQRLWSFFNHEAWYAAAVVIAGFIAMWAVAHQ